MKIKLITFIIFYSIILNCQSLSQHLPEEILGSSVLIESNYGQGSGFYIQDSLHCYFITATHNIIQKLKQNYTTKIDTVKKIKLISYPRDPSSSVQNVSYINLEKAFQKGLVKIHKSQDITIILVGNTKVDTNKQSFVYYYDIVRKGESSKIWPAPISVIQTFKNTFVSDDVYIIGYPTSLGYSQEKQYDFERPLLRKGIVAGKNYNNHTIIIDCASYPGNSGGPVIVSFSEKIGTISYFIIGITVEFIPYVEKWKNFNNKLINTYWYNSGYSVVVSSTYIKELINEFNR